MVLESVEFDEFWRRGSNEKGSHEVVSMSFFLFVFCTVGWLVVEAIQSPIESVSLFIPVLGSHVVCTNMGGA